MRWAPAAQPRQPRRGAIERLEERRLLSVDSELFVASLYTRLLGRAADQDGLAFWAAKHDGGLSRDSLVGDFLRTPERLTRNVDLLYSNYLGRDADDAGRAHFLGRLEAGASLLLVQSEILGSAEYAAARGTTAQYVAAVFEDALGRQADDAGKQHYLDRLADGEPAADTALSILSSDESHRRIVNDNYINLLGRNADPDGLEFWAGVLSERGQPDQVIAGILGSQEYFATISQPDDTSPPVLLAALANDTGSSAADRITFDPAIRITATDNVRVASLRVGLDGAAIGDFIEIGDRLDGDHVDLSRTDLSQLFPAALADGPHVLHAVAADAAGNASPVFELAFTLDTALPSIFDFGLSPGSDTGTIGDQTTQDAIVTLAGRTEPGAVVRLDGLQVSVVASAAGAFDFPDIPLDLGENVFLAQAMDAAGNPAALLLTVHRVDQADPVDPVIAWNQQALGAILSDASDPLTASRSLAMVQAAVYDAVNAVLQAPGRFITFPVPAGASLSAAVARAGRDVLVYLYPAQQAAFDAALTATLASVPDGQSEADGASAGAQAAAAIIALRRTDGFDDFSPYVASVQAGAWQATSPMFAEALKPQWAALRPWAMSTADQFLPAGPPDLASSEWAAAFDEVKSLGAANSSLRTAEQTQIARFWADGGGTFTPAGHWNAIAAQVAQAQGNSLEENARLFAQLGVALADAAIVAWNAKYEYKTWRPITAIQQAETAGNAAVTSDPGWTPLLITPPFPEYVSGHSTFSAAAAGILSAAFGTDVGFTTSSSSLPGASRTFASFEAAAQEAGRSRVYGGIHFEFANQDGLAAGRALADFVLGTFDATEDVMPPTVILTSPAGGVVAPQNVVVEGRVLDNLSGVASLTVALDEGIFAPLALDAQGNFTYSSNLPVDGSADGNHTVYFQAVDHAGNVGPRMEFPWTLDTQAPVVTVTSLADHDALTGLSRLAGTADGTGSALTRLTYAFDDSLETPFGFSSSGSFDVALDVSRLALGPHVLRVWATDAAGHTTQSTFNLALPELIPFAIASVSPSQGAVDVGVTFRPQVFFSRPVEPASLTQDNLFLTGPDGAKLPARIVPADDGSFAWLFLAGPMPGGARLTLHVDGGTIRAAADGAPLDADRDGLAGGAFESTFSSVSLAPLSGTTLSGKVVDPGPDLAPMTFDDIRAGADQALHTPDDVFLRPLAGVKVFILGLEDQFVLTDAAGNFHFDAVPAGNVKLALDGRTATNAPAGLYFPEMVMDLNLRAGQANTAMGTMGTLAQQLANADRGEVYLPRLRTDILQELSPTERTVVTVDPASAPKLTPEQRARLTLTVEPGSLIGHDGQPVAQGQIGISTVPPELVRDMLPAGLLQHTFDITVQAPGIDRFTTPVAMTFPNLFGGAPGSQLSFLSFDHTTGRLVIEGTATVSADGLTASTDPGTGITHPGWHGLTPPGGPTAQCPPDEYDVNVDPVILASGLQNYFFKDDDGSFTLSFDNGADPILSEFGPCDSPNNRATPLVVEIFVEGTPDNFLTGLATQTFGLLPGQGKEIRVDVRPLLDRLPFMERDQMWGVGIEVSAHKFGAPSDELLREKFYVYRFVDAADAVTLEAASDGIVEFADTLADGELGVTRKRLIDYLSPAAVKPEIEILEFDNFVSESGNLIFDPEVVGDNIEGTANVITPDGQIAGTLDLRGDGTPRIKLDVNKAQFLSTLAAIITDAQSSGGNVEPVLFTGPERDLLATVPLRSAFADDLADLMIAAFANVGAGVELGSGANSIIYNWLSSPAIGSYGDSAIPTPADAVDIGHGDGNRADVDRDIFDLFRSLSDHSLAVQSFMLSELMNQSTQTNVTVYLDNPIESQGSGLLNLNREQMLNVLTKLSVHEAGHTLGLMHTAQVIEATAVLTVEEQRITLTGGTLGDTFALTFNGDTTAPLRFDADGNDVMNALRALPSVGGGNVLVNGPAGGPYFLDFAFDFRGVDVPLVTGVGTGALVVTSVTVVPGSTHHGPLTVPGGTTDFMYGGRLDPFGSLAFRPKLSQDGLKVGLHLDWTSEEAQNVILFWANHLAARTAGGFFDGVPGTEATALDGVPFPGPHLFIFDEFGQLTFRGVDLGTAGMDGPAGAQSTRSFALRNIGSDPLVLNSISAHSASGAFSVNAIPAGAILQPGAELPLIITFDPSVSGADSGYLSISSNDPSAPTRIDVAGFGLSPDGDVRVDVTNNNLGGRRTAAGAFLRDDAITLRNIGASPLTVTDVRFAAASEFAAGGLPIGFGPGQPLVIAPGGSFTFDVSFDPGVTGLRRGVLEILTDDPQTPVFRQTFVGTGLADTGMALDYGNDFVALETPQLPGTTLFRQRSDDGGNWSFFLPVDEAIHSVIFDPASGLLSHAYDVTAATFGGAPIPPPFFLASTANDTDGDGLPDDVEFAVGTGLNDADTDNDGLSDFVEIAHGLDPLGGLGLPTGIVAAVALQGQTLEVTVEGSLTDSTVQTAFAATGPHGLAIVDVTQPAKPVLLGELNLVGVNSDVAIDLGRNLAVLAAGAVGVHLVDVSNPSSPALAATVVVPGTATRLELAGGIAYVAVGNAVVSIDLASRAIRQSLPVGDRAITDLAIEGSTLYVLDENDTLQAISLDGLGMAVRGSLFLSGALGRLSVGEGIAYVPASNAGILSVDVGDPANLVLMSDSDLPPGFAAQSADFAVTGSGLGLLIADLNQPPPLPPRIDVLDVFVVTDPTNTNEFVTRVSLPALPRGQAIGSGFAFIANDLSGLQIVNFQPLDTEGQAPEIAIAADGADRDPIAPGIQVRPGAIINVQADVHDDVLVRSVELLVNGQVVRNDVSFPWDLLASAPVADETTILLIQARATDTGGNTGISNLLTIEVLPDLVAPALVATSPGEGQKAPRVNAIDLFFDEGLDGDLLDAAGVTLTNLGADGLPGGGDDTTAAIVELVLRDQGRILTIVPAAELPPGPHRLTVDAAILADPAGNHLLSPVELTFSVARVNAISAASGFPTDPELPSANPGQEISFVMPWGPEAARIEYPAIHNDIQFRERLQPSRTDPVTRTAYFIVPDNAVTGEIALFGGGANDVSDLPNWTFDGAVNLFGEDVTGFSFNNRLPGNGLYLDLGTTTGNGSPLESKMLFDLAPGDYELRFDLAGALSPALRTVDVSLGDAFAETFTRPTASPFATFTRIITLDNPATARLVFKHVDLDIAGLHLDNVKLTRVDSGTVLLDDHFDLPLPNGTFPLQIVPTVTLVDITSVSSDGSMAVATLDGGGFIEGENTVYQFGSVAVVDLDVNTGPEVLEVLGVSDNSRATLTLPLSAAAFGHISVTTAGGRSAPFVVGASAISGTAFSGTPADPAIASANPGQSITVNGAGLKTTTDIVVQHADESGTVKTLLIHPTLADLDGTSAQVILPAALNGVVQLRVFGSPDPLPVQIVPVIQQGSVIGGTLIQLTGRGFFEGDSTYDVGGILAFDTEFFGGPDVTGANSAVDLAAVAGESAAVTVMTPGGTSAPILVNVPAPPELPAPTITSIANVAADGVPANSAEGSANTGQVIVIQGANFRLGDLQVLFPTRDENGVNGTLGVAPLAVNDAGTQAQVRVPDLAATGALRVTTVGGRNLGFGEATDAIHRGIALTFTPASATVELRFADGGLSGLSDEGWGLDNVQVVRGAAAVFSDDFQGAHRPEWSSATTADSPLAGTFSGPFSTSVQTLTLAGLTAGAPHTLRFDLYVLDSWDGLDASHGPDRFLVLAGAETLFDEAFSNDPEKTQTFAASDAVRLQIVPTITGTSHHEGNSYDLGLNILGSGFIEGAGTITIGGLAIQDDFPDSAGSLFDNSLLYPNVVAGSGNQDYELFGGAPFTLDGPIRVTTAGGYFEIAGPSIRRPEPVSFTGILSTAEQGIPLDPNLPSANTGQVITLTGSFAPFDEVLVQFDAVDDAGTPGVVTRGGASQFRQGRSISITVPESARTGMVRVLGSPGEFFLQIVPTLHGVGPLIAGTETVMQGTGLLPGDLSLTVDGQPVAGYTVQTVRNRADARPDMDRQFVTFTVPAAIGPGVLEAVTSGGTATVHPGAAPTAAPDLTPAADPGGTISTALAVTTVSNGRLTVRSNLEPRPEPEGDIDLYQLNFQAGERIVIDLAASLSDGNSDTAFVRLFNAAGQELTFDYEPPESALGRLEFTAPFTGAYFLGVSDVFHGGYNPVTGEQFPFEAPDEGYPTGPYQLHIRRLAADATVLAGISASAASGAAAHPGVPSANTGQVITLTGSGLRAGEQVVFIRGSGAEIVVEPLSVAADGGSLSVLVPDDAVSGIVRLTSDAVGVSLQIVPTFDGLEVFGFAFRGDQPLGKSGTGFDHPATIHFGGVGFEFPSEVSNIGLNPAGAPLGPLSITTPGGTSAPLAGPDLVSIAAVAASGVPANASLPSANPGQAITLQGSRFTAFEIFERSATMIVFRTMDAAGVRREWLAEPTSVDPTGTQMTVIVPDDAVTAAIGVLGDPQGTTIVLQVVPLVTSVVTTSPGVVQVAGKGLVEGGTLYRFGANEVLDGSLSTAGVNVLGDNDTANVDLPVLGSGSLTVTTAGGTSAPLPFGALMSAHSAPASGLTAASGVPAASLTPDLLRTFVDEAIARFTAAGVAPHRLSGAQTAWQIGELPGNYLGLFANNTILVDRNAAGWGWYIDPAPHDDVEFSPASNRATSAVAGIDLLTAVIHELGHVLGLDHDDDGFMADALSTGERRLPWSLADPFEDACRSIPDAPLDEVFATWD